MFNDKQREANSKLQCKNCSAPVTFQPGTKSLVCDYCGTHNEITYSTQTQAKAVKEFSFADYRDIDDSKKQDLKVLKCGSCGASTSYGNNTTAGTCPFCAAPLVTSGATTASVIKPTAIIPFAVAQKRALDEFRKYTGNKFFTPREFRNLTETTDSLHGMYIPYWTYDAEVHTNYTGERGDDYQTTETYTAVENGKNVSKTRTVTKTRWYNTSGTVANNFDDLTVIASKSLPAKQANNLAPWNFKALVPYSDAYLAGFSAEMYNINIEHGFAAAQQLMEGDIKQSIYSDIGGDRQRIDRYASKFYGVTFRHILLPIWINTYKYKGKSYHFLINGQTGEVQGETPFSFQFLWYIVAAILSLGVIMLILAAMGAKT